MAVTLHHGDAVAWANAYDGPLFHALLTDAPYEMNFMGREWDASGVAFDPETWRAFAKVLHPGAFLIVAAGTLNDDLISVAMREAGLRKFHKAINWAYGSGFPKASRIDTQIDKAAGAERKVLGQRKASGVKTGDIFSDDNYIWPGVVDVTEPATPLAKVWAGHRYGLQSLKPAAETLLIFQKPYAARPVDAITTTGAGALNIEAARIEMQPGDKKMQGGELTREAPGRSWFTQNTDRDFDRNQGRWPANLLLSCCGLSPHAPECPVELLGRQSGELKSALRGPNCGQNGGDKFGGETYGDKMQRRGYPPGTTYGDTGTAARFFFHATADRLDDADPVFYTAKASRRERDAGLEGMPLKEVQTHGEMHADVSGGSHNTTGQRPALARNTHPTIKPLSLCRYLATLLLPPPEYGPRRLFVPFAGAGSECLGAMQAGWEHVEGVELEADHVEIGRARIAHWSGATRPAPAPVAVPAAPETLPLLAAMEAA